MRSGTRPGTSAATSPGAAAVGAQRSRPELTAALETRSLAARVSRGPSQNSPQFRPAAKAAASRGPIDTLPADGAFDAEHNYAYARDRLGIRSTAIPLNRRNPSRRWPKSRYLRQTINRFRKEPRGSRHRRVHGQRCQTESGFSRNRRLLGSALRTRRWPSQRREVLMRVLTHNLMLLAAAEGVGRAKLCRHPPASGLRHTSVAPLH